MPKLRDYASLVQRTYETDFLPASVPDVPATLRALAPVFATCGRRLNLTKRTQMKSHSIWMPIYVGDYLSDTIHLTNAEHGAYFLAMLCYWKKGGPLTTKELYSICKKEIDSISNFFQEHDGLWSHKRIDDELAKAEKRFKSAQEKSRLGVEARLANMKLPQRKVK